MNQDLIDQTLQQRGENYGNFNHFAIIQREFKRTIDRYKGNLDPTQLIAIEQITLKISRILNGNPHYADNWVDIAGYAKLGGRLYQEEDQHSTNKDNLC